MEVTCARGRGTAVTQWFVLVFIFRLGLYEHIPLLPGNSLEYEFELQNATCDLNSVHGLLILPFEGYAVRGDYWE